MIQHRLLFILFLVFAMGRLLPTVGPLGTNKCDSAMLPRRLPIADRSLSLSIITAPYMSRFVLFFLFGFWFLLGQRSPTEIWRLERFKLALALQGADTYRHWRSIDVTTGGERNKTKMWNRLQSLFLFISILLYRLLFWLTVIEDDEPASLN